MNEPTEYYTYTTSPLGDILIAGTESGLTHISFQEGSNALAPREGWVEDASFLQEANDQLHAYFYGELTRFDIPLRPQGTEFQQRVWTALLTIPYGETVSYARIAEQLGQPTATRAVASANGQNPLPIVIPCHRVIGSDGKLRGYASGLEIKAELLALEQANSSITGGQLLL